MEIAEWVSNSKVILDVVLQNTELKLSVRHCYKVLCPLEIGATFVSMERDFSLFTTFCHDTVKERFVRCLGSLQEEIATLNNETFKRDVWLLVKLQDLIEKYQVMYTLCIVEITFSGRWV